jgi:AraC-like DNA-binding protein
MLEALRVRTAVYCRSELRAPWGLKVAGSPEAKFHLVLNGSAVLRLDGGGEEAVLEAGDLALLPRGSGHVLRDKSTSRARRLDRILIDHPVDPSGILRYGGRGSKSLVVCGAFDTASSGPLLAWLPPLLVLDTATNGLGRWLDPMLELVRPPRSANPGDAAVLAKVADVFLTDVLRHYLSSSNGPKPIDDGTEDPPIVEALDLIHTRASEPWTISTLARQVGMSRSAFAARFQAAVGTAPIGYLTRVRLAGAAGSLATSTRPLAEIARAAGYDNESSFSKAFTRHFGQPPGRYRESHRRALEDASR